MQPHEHLVIIGNGIAGVTLAQHIRMHSSCRITLISAESKNHISRPALMYAFLGQIRRRDLEPYEEWFWQEHKLERVHAEVKQVKTDEKKLVLRDHAEIKYDVLVIASGSVAKFYNWPGQELQGVQGLVHLQDLDKLEENVKHAREAVIVGGGLIGVELAEMLLYRGLQVTMLVREPLYFSNVLPEAEAVLVTEHLQNHGVKLLLGEELTEILPDEKGGVRAIRTAKGAELPCQLVGLTTGVKPNVSFLQNSGLKLDKGVVVNEFFETNISGIYAIGDCAEFYDPDDKELVLEQLWYTARQHAEVLAQTLLGKRTPYCRQPWFNSAKFFDIEYQTYGIVPPAWDIEIYDSLYWQHSNRQHAIRILYRKKDLRLVGVNLLGIRYRHDVCHAWLKRNAELPEVIKNLHQANFDPEFAKKFEPAIIRQFNKKYPEHALEPELKKSWWRIFR